MPKIPLSVIEVATTHNIPKRTVIDAIWRGKLKAQKMPGLTGAWLLDPADVNAWLATRNRKDVAS